MFGASTTGPIDSQGTGVFALMRLVGNIIDAKLTDQCIDTGANEILHTVHRNWHIKLISLFPLLRYTYNEAMIFIVSSI